MLKDIPLKDQVTFSEPDDSGLFGLSFLAFNTVITLRAYSTETASGKRGIPEVEEVAQGLVERCRRYEWLLSRTLEGSDLARINAAQGEVVEVDHETWQALQAGVFYSSKSKGTFDITMGSVTRLWDFANGKVPSRQMVSAALSHVDWRKLELFEIEDASASSYCVRLADPEAIIDLGGTAKGFIADRLCAYLKDVGIEGAFVNLGGNVAFFGGKPDGSPWRIGIQDPFDRAKIRGAVAIRDGSVVTSGLYERCFTSEGVLYHHILDCRTGFPVESDIAGATVISRTSQDADGYSTTLFALGRQEALKFLDETESVEGLVITKDGICHPSAGLAEFAQIDF